MSSKDISQQAPEEEVTEVVVVGGAALVGGGGVAAAASSGVAAHVAPAEVGETTAPPAPEPTPPSVPPRDHVEVETTAPPASEPTTPSVPPRDHVEVVVGGAPLVGGGGVAAAASGEAAPAARAIAPAEVAETELGKSEDDFWEFKFKEAGLFYNKICPVCLEALLHTDVLAAFGCAHWVHRHCYRSDIVECPLCKTAVNDCKEVVVGDVDNDDPIEEPYVPDLSVSVGTDTVGTAERRCSRSDCQIQYGFGFLIYTCMNCSQTFCEECYRGLDSCLHCTSSLTEFSHHIGQRDLQGADSDDAYITLIHSDTDTDDVVDPSGMPDAGTEAGA